MNYRKPFFFWLVFLAVAVTCGIGREKLLIPALGPMGGRAAGTFLVGVIIFGLICLYVKRLKDADKNALWQLGVFWTVLTIVFECLCGHYVGGYSWELLMADYNVFQGKLWPLVLMVTLFGPVLAGKMGTYRRV